MTIPGLAVDLDGAAPVYRQIADGIRAALDAGRLMPGQQLPPTRDLAKQIGVNRNTVIAAYDLLIEEGAATGQTGRGTFLAASSRSAHRESGMRTGPDAPWFGAFARAVEGPGVGSLL